MPVLTFLIIVEVVNGFIKVSSFEQVLVVCEPRWVFPLQDPLVVLESYPLKEGAEPEPADCFVFRAFECLCWFSVFCCLEPEPIDLVKIILY